MKEIIFLGRLCMPKCNKPAQTTGAQYKKRSIITKLFNTWKAETLVKDSILELCC